MKAALEAKELVEGAPAGFSVVLVDISGSARMSAVLDLLERYETVFSDSLRLLIVKSFRLACLLDRARCFEPSGSTGLQGEVGE